MSSPDGRLRSGCLCYTVILCVQLLKEHKCCEYDITDETVFCLFIYFSFPDVALCRLSCDKIRKLAHNFFLSCLVIFPERAEALENEKSTICRTTICCVQGVVMTNFLQEQFDFQLTICQENKNVDFFFLFFRSFYYIFTEHFLAHSSQNNGDFCFDVWVGQNVFNLI